MEDLIVIVIQFVVEFFVQVVFGLFPELVEASFHKLDKSHKHSPFWYLFFIVLGIGAGFASLHFMRDFALHSMNLRVSFLFFAPIASGFVSYLIASHGADREHPWAHAWTSALFLFACLATRFVVLENISW